MTAKVWQWDVRRSDEEVRRILKNPQDANFLYYSSLLLARSNSPKEVFGSYLKIEDFCREWPGIKRRMRKDQWNAGRIQFWEEIYRHLKEKLKVKGVALRKPKSCPPSSDSLRVRIGRRIHEARRFKKITQRDLARGAGLTQQFVSQIEKGAVNVSLDTVERIQKFLGQDLCNSCELIN